MRRTRRAILAIELKVSGGASSIDGSSSSTIESRFKAGSLLDVMVGCMNTDTKQRRGRREDIQNAISKDAHPILPKANLISPLADVAQLTYLLHPLSGR